MITFNYLMAQALIVLNAKLKKENTAKRIGGLFRDLLLYIQNLILGIILKGEKENEAAIKAIINPTKGDTYKAADTKHYWCYDGTGWNDIGEIIPSNIATKEELKDLENEMEYYSDLFTIKGKYIRKAGAVEINDANMMCTIHLPVSLLEDIELDCRATDLCAPVYFFDKLKNPISYYNIANGNYDRLVIPLQDIPEGTRFIRASCSISTDNKNYRIYKGVNTLSLSVRVDELEETINTELEDYVAKAEVQTELNDSELPISSNAVYELGIKRIDDSANIIYAITDKDNRFLFGIRADGTTLIPKGMPDDVVTEFQNYIKATQVEKELTNSENPIAAGAIPMENTESSEYVYALTDANNSILMAFRKDGTAYIPSVDEELSDKLSKEVIDLSNSDNNEFIYVITDSDNKVLFGIRKNGSIYPTISGGGGGSGSGLFKNNLKNQDKSSVELVSGAYGGKSVYKIPITGNVFRIVFDFTLTANINTNNIGKYIANLIKNDTVVGGISTINFATETLFRTFAQNPFSEASLLQVPKYNSGFKVLGTDYIRDAEFFQPIIGEMAFCVWLQGSDKPLTDFYGENKTTGEQWLADREQWLADNRDYAIVIENDTFSIIRDGIDVTTDAPSFNGGATSVIYSTSLKENGSWRTLKSLYEELKALTVSGQPLESIWINFYDLSSRKTCADLHQFGKIKMVGRYYQQITNISSDYGVQQQMRYDSFPVPIRFAIDETKHICEIVGMNGNIYAQVDGQMASIVNAGIDTITIGGSNTGINGDIIPFNLSVNMGDNGDAEVMDTAGVQTIISERSPYTVGIMGHYLIDDIEGNVSGTSNLGQSLTRMEDICIHLRDKGYIVVSIDELISMRLRGMFPAKRIAFFVFDDRRIENIYETFRHRQSISKFGYPANLASVQAGQYENNPDRYFPLITTMRSNGWNNLSHSYFHNVPYRAKNSIVLYAELNEVLRVADLLNMNNNALCYSFSCGWDVTYTLLRMRGFALCIHNNNPYFNTLASGQYSIARVNMADETNWAMPTRYLI